MNIFMTSSSPLVSAQALDDKRVIKMALESAQMLSTCLRENATRDIDSVAPDTFYRSTHKHHPCTRWLERRLGNFMWLRDHGLYLCDEYSHRFDREHASRPLIERSIDFVGHSTSIPLHDVVPEYGGFNSSGYDTGNVFHDYKLCMIDKWRDDNDPRTTSRACRWTRRGPPGWLDKSIIRPN